MAFIGSYMGVFFVECSYSSMYNFNGYATDEYLHPLFHMHVITYPCLNPDAGFANLYQLMDPCIEKNILC